MRLKEFDLDAPSAEKWVRHSFREQTRCVTAHYERLFEGMETKDIWKVLVECVPHTPRPDAITVLGVLTIQQPFLFETFETATESVKKEIALDVLHTGVARLCELQNWSLAPFAAAHRGVISAGYKNEWIWKKKSSPNRKLVAQVRCEHEVNTFRGWLEVHDKDGHMVSQTLAIDTKPSEFVFAPKMGALTWKDAARVSVVASNGGEVASVAL